MSELASNDQVTATTEGSRRSASQLKPCGWVQHFAKSHGGEVQALARLDGGTIIRLTLPLASTTHQEGSPRTDLPPDNRPDETKTDE